MILKESWPWKRVLGGLAILLIATYPAVRLYAQTSGTLEVTFEALETIAIQEVTQLNFKRILAPSSGSQTFTVNTDGTTSTAIISGSGGGRFLDNPQRGMLYLSGTDGEFFNISGLPAGTGNCTGSGPVGIVKLTAIEVFPPMGILDRPEDIGGTLQVDSTASGPYECFYTVTADYQ